MAQISQQKKQNEQVKKELKPINNLVAFFELLYEWDLKDNENKKKEI